MDKPKNNQPEPEELGGDDQDTEVLRRFRNDGTSIQADQTVHRDGSTVSGYIILWGSPDNPDPDGEFFTPDTKISFLSPDDESLPITIYDPRQRGGLKIGELTKTKVDENGLTVEGYLNLDTPEVPQIVRDTMLRLIDEGKLAFASSAFDPKRTDDGKIKEWNMVSASFTPVPDKPKNDPDNPLLLDDKPKNNTDIDTDTTDT